MRILMLSQFYPPIIGGAEQHVRNLSIALASRGHKVAVVTLQHRDQAEYELDQGVQVYRIRSSLQRVSLLFRDSGRQYAPPFPDPELMLALRRIIQRERPEIVHAHNWLVYAFLPLKAWSRAKLIVTLHDYNLVCARTTFMYHNACCKGPGIVKCLGCAAQYYGVAKGIPTVLGNWVMGLVQRDAVDMFLPVSQAVALNTGLVDGQRPFQVMSNFMPDDAAVLDAGSQCYVSQLPAEDYLLFVGAFNRQKGVDVLLRAYAGLPGAPPLVLIGYQTPEWSALAENLPANVFVFNDWPRAAVLEAWHRSVIGLFPSVGPETFGIAALEAMWAGRPVISSRTGGLVDLVSDGETGLLVPPGDPLALQQAIKQLLAHPGLRKRMGQAAQQKALAFQESRVVPRIEQVYAQVVA
ncbi:MAG: glycosyltransferase family 4 protein [Ktedonobacteraceae bacterium]|nr:glycosyltransferase family 4 protein [Ktedonobacteraceae bacterium]